MGANAGIASLIGTIVLVVIGLMMLGLVEDGVTDALTASKTVTMSASSSGTLPGLFSGGEKSWYANKRIDIDPTKLTLPPGYSVTGCATAGNNILTEDRLGIQCRTATGLSLIHI